MGMDVTEPVLVWTGKAMLDGHMAIPPVNPAGVVIFASAPALADDQRDRQLISDLYAIGIATLHVPLLTDDELHFDAHSTHFRYDADFLAARFIDIAQWLQRNRVTDELPIVYIASSGGAAGALVAAAQRPDLVEAVVSIDGRTDLAFDHLRNFKTPTLLVVRDMPVLRMNREALTLIRGDKRIEVVHDTGYDALVQKVVHWVEEKLARVPA